MISREISTKTTYQVLKLRNVIVFRKSSDSENVSEKLAIKAWSCEMLKENSWWNNSQSIIVNVQVRKKICFSSREVLSYFSKTTVNHILLVLQQPDTWCPGAKLACLHFRPVTHRKCHKLFNHRKTCIKSANGHIPTAMGQNGHAGQQCGCEEALENNTEASGDATVATISHLLLESTFQTQHWLSDFQVVLEQRQVESDRLAAVWILNARPSRHSRADKCSCLLQGCLTCC